MTEHSPAPAERVTAEPLGEVPLRERRPEGSNPVARAFSAVGLFLQQVLDELSKIVRPTREELVSYTIVVIVFVLAMMMFVFGLDQLFSWVVEKVFA